MNRESALHTTRSEEVISSNQSPFTPHSKVALKGEKLTKYGQVLDFLMGGASLEPPSQLPLDSELQVKWRKMVFRRDRKGRNALQTFIDENRVDVAKRFLDMHISTTGVNE